MAQAGPRNQERGYAMVALLILMAVMAIAMTVALPAWSTLARREREAELAFRGEQYARAIVLFQRKYGGAYPPNVDVLVTERFLRKKYKDPITNDDFQTIAVGQAVAGPQTANPLDPTGRSSGGRAGTASQPARATGPGGAAPQTGSRGGFTISGGGTTLSAPGGVTIGGRGTAQSPFTLQGGAPGVGGAGASPGIMGVTSKSTDPSLRVYKGADHYNQWLFIGTLAAAQAGGRGAQTPGQGVRGGQPPGARPGGPAGPAGGRGGLQAPSLPGSPFGTSPFGGGQQPMPTPSPGGRR